jgi:hypothetical protein
VNQLLRVAADYVWGYMCGPARLGERWRADLELVVRLRGIFHPEADDGLFHVMWGIPAQGFAASRMLVALEKGGPL